MLVLLVAAADCGSSEDRSSARPDAASNGPHGDDGAGDGAMGTTGSADGGSGSDDGALACGDAGIAGPTWSDPGAAAPVEDPSAVGKTHHFFHVSVVDQNQAPVIGATLTTTNQAIYTADRNGNVAFYEPGLMDTDVWFTPSCPGYTSTPDGLGNSGAALHPTEGGSGTITMKKTGTPSAPDPGDLQTRLLANPVPGAANCLALRAVDRVTKRGVPLVKFVTKAGDAYWSDSQGMVAFCDPDFIGKSVAFDVSCDGYALASGTSMTVTAAAGTSQQVAMVRQLPGQILYRTTGQGIYRDSTLLGLTVPVVHPNINGLVAGQDTPMTFTWGGNLYWLWGDTNRPAYPLGNFDTSGATSTLPGDGGLSPDLGVNTNYFVDSNGFCRGMTDTTGDPKLTSGSSSPVWTGQLVSVTDAQSQAHIFGSYYVASSTPWTALAEYARDANKFRFVSDFPAGAVIPTGRSTVVNGSGGAYAYWSNPVRFPATVDAVTDTANYEVFTAYAADGKTLNKNADGTLAYAWRRGGTVVTGAALSSAKVSADQQLDGHLTDVIGGGGVQVSNGPAGSLFASSIMWNGYRGRFSGITQQQYGVSFLGESWYAEADTPLGPWVFARKVVTHAASGYTFYNPDVIPYFSEAGGRIVFFDATYTKTYSNVKTPTPRYDYNELMVRLDLDDPEMALPVAVYARGTAMAPELVTKRGLRSGDPAMVPAFFAYDTAARGTVAVAWSGASCGARRLTVGGSPATPALFYALPPDAVDAGGVPATVPLYEYTGASGGAVYSVDPALSGLQRGAVIARVWATPIRVPLAIADFLGDLVADAGPDQCVKAAADGGHVTLDASATRSLAGPVTQYTWVSLATGCAIATGPTANVVLPVGITNVRLEASDAQGNTSSDDVVIDVAP
jgi:hypothetical protein